MQVWINFSSPKDRATLAINSRIVFWGWRSGGVEETGKCSAPVDLSFHLKAWDSGPLLTFYRPLNSSRAPAPAFVALGGWTSYWTHFWSAETMWVLLDSTHLPELTLLPSCVCQRAFCSWCWVRLEQFSSANAWDYRNSLLTYGNYWVCQSSCFCCGSEMFYSFCEAVFTCE